jgi:hypothetical protein
MRCNRQIKMRHLRWLAAALCLGHLSGCLNPAFVNSLGVGSGIPLAPGDTPFIQVLFINATTRFTIDTVTGWTPSYQGFNSVFLTTIAPAAQRGFLLGCPIDQIGLGSPNDLTIPAIVLSENGELVAEVPPSAFPLTLMNGRDYLCGDTVVFTIVEDQNNGYGIAVSPGRVDGATQRGPFSGPDTFQIYQVLQLGTGLPPVVVP